jgi:hypothetical protein
MALKTAGYLIKPLRLDSLLRLVARLCGQRAAAGIA